MSRLSVPLALLAVLAASAEAQRVQLELRPRSGDTLRIQLDQVTEVMGTREGSAPKQAMTSLRMFSRAIVERSAPAATLILAVTDSVHVTTNDEHARELAAQTQRQLEGRQMRLRLLPDGSVTVADPSSKVPKEINDIVSVMPASFPRGAVAVGDTWMREMPLPPGARLGVPVGGVVRARFRLDSLSRGGDLAYVSMRGALQTSSNAAPSTDDDPLSGTVSGSMVVNRRRGWLAESRFTVQMRTRVVEIGAARATPMEFTMKVTQHMRVSEKR